MAGFVYSKSEKMKVKIINKSVNPLPAYATPGSAGLDICSYESALFLPGERKLIKTGLYIQLPAGYEAQVRPRSGLALKKGLTVLNSPGTIDSDYRGEIGVILYNSSKEDQYILIGDRIAQLVIAKYESIFWEEVEHLGNTHRDDGGFGSTGTSQHVVTKRSVFDAVIDHLRKGGKAKITGEEGHYYLKVNPKFPITAKGEIEGGYFTKVNGDLTEEHIIPSENLITRTDWELAE
jgi:dUTP pyrophosphatase